MRPPVWMALLAPLVMFAGSAPAMAQDATFPFSCTLDLSKLRPADSQKIPIEYRGRSLLTTGEKKCTFSAAPTVQIRCTAIVNEWDWGEGSEITVKRLAPNEFCEIPGDSCNLDLEGQVNADNMTFKVRQIDAETAELDLFCVKRSR